jgi:hypothetical protein
MDVQVDEGVAHPPSIAQARRAGTALAQA